MKHFLLKSASLLVCIGMVGVVDSSAQVLSLPASEKGTTATTLVVYPKAHASYSLANDLAALKLQLARVATHIEAVTSADAETNKITEADYVVMFCPQPHPEFSEQQLQAVAQRKNPVLWVGYGADLLERYPPFENQFKVAAFAAAKPAATIVYQGRAWNEPLNIWLPATILATNVDAVIMSAQVRRGDTNLPAQPFAWRSAHATFYAALPTLTANCALFSDLLLDFYGVSDKTPGVVCVRIDGYHCRQDHMEFRNLVNYLFERKYPFIVGVIPAYYEAAKDKTINLESQPEFVAALRFAQERGGRLVLQGYQLGGKGRSALAPEFWDADADRPVAEDSPEYVRQRIERGLKLMFDKGLFPLAWETPKNAASSLDYLEIARFFSTSVERVQLSDATGQETFAGSACGVDEYGRLIVPENLGVVTGKRSALVRIQERSQLLSQLRGTVAMCSFPAHLTDDKLIQAVKALEQSHAPFLDLADGNHWVQTSEVLLLAGNARRSVSLNNARILWQAYGRDGRLLAEEYEPMSTTGERVFERRGKGDYEIYRFNQGKP